jgi:hypothetical protein
MLGPLRLMMHRRFSSPSIVFNAGAAVVGLSLRVGRYVHLSCALEYFVVLVLVLLFVCLLFVSVRYGTTTQKLVCLFVKRQSVSQSSNR